MVGNYGLYVSGLSSHIPQQHRRATGMICPFDSSIAVVVSLEEADENHSDG